MEAMEIVDSDSSSDSVVITGSNFPAKKSRNVRRRLETNEEDGPSQDDKVCKIRELEDLVIATASLPGGGEENLGAWSGSDSKSTKGGRTRGSSSKYLKKIKTLQQNKRRQETRISRLTNEVRSLRDKNTIQAAYIDVLCGIIGGGVKEKFRDRQGHGILGNTKIDDEDHLAGGDENNEDGVWELGERAAKPIDSDERKVLTDKEKQFYCVEDLNDITDGRPDGNPEGTLPEEEDAPAMSADDEFSECEETCDREADFTIKHVDSSTHFTAEDELITVDDDSPPKFPVNESAANYLKCDLQLGQEELTSTSTGYGKAHLATTYIDPRHPTNYASGPSTYMESEEAVTFSCSQHDAVAVADHRRSFLDVGNIATFVTEQDRASFIHVENVPTFVDPKHEPPYEDDNHKAYVAFDDIATYVGSDSAGYIGEFADGNEKRTFVQAEETYVEAPDSSGFVVLPDIKPKNLPESQPLDSSFILSVNPDAGPPSTNSDELGVNISWSVPQLPTNLHLA